MRAPDWTREEFELLLARPNDEDVRLAERLPKRTEGAVSWVRGGIHGYHRGGDTSPLSKMMLEVLDQRDHEFLCARCKERI